MDARQLQDSKRANHLVVGLDAMNLEHVLGKINADCDNLHVDAPSMRFVSDDPMAHRCRSGRRLPHQWGCVHERGSNRYVHPFISRGSRHGTSEGWLVVLTAAAPSPRLVNCAWLGDTVGAPATNPQRSVHLSKLAREGADRARAKAESKMGTIAWDQ
jgi:hypothetical protein